MEAQTRALGVLGRGGGGRVEGVGVETWGTWSTLCDVTGQQCRAPLGCWIQSFRMTFTISRH